MIPFLTCIASQPSLLLQMQISVTPLDRLILKTGKYSKLQDELEFQYVPNDFFLKYIQGLFLNLIELKYKNCVSVYS